MSARRARMKAGHRPIIVECAIVPEHPTYWHVPESASAAVALLVEAGQVEYEPAFARTDGGQFAVQAAVAPVAPAGGGTRPFARKGPRS